MQIRLTSLALIFALGLGCGDDPKPDAPNSRPSFSGLVSVAPDHEGRLILDWKNGTDDVTTPEHLVYRVYGSTKGGKALQFPAHLTTLAGVTTATIDAMPKGTRHYFTVRAVDEAGNEDDNVAEVSAVAEPDNGAPTFAGVTLAEPIGDAGIRLRWDPAADDRAPSPSLRYQVFSGPGGGAVDFSQPIGSTNRGELSIELRRLGKPGEPRLFAVRAVDVAGNTEGNTKSVSASLGSDIGAPAFGGCGNVVSTTPKTLSVTWAPASDDYTPPAAISYDVYLATAAGAHDFTAPPAATTTGGTSLVVSGLTPGATYHVVCRARDNAANRDANVAEKVVTLSSDATPPTFVGLSTVTTDSIARTVTLNWTAATDNVTATGDIVYDVFQADVPLGQKFDGAPLATSTPGATSLVVNSLPPRKTLYWIVRARDQAGNFDTNKVELSGTTKTSFSLNVQPVLTSTCAVVGCHVSGIAAGGLVLSPAFSFDSIVSVKAGQQPAVPGTWFNRVEPGNSTTSYLYRKIAPLSENLPVANFTNKMPAPATGNALSVEEVAIVRDWINEGANRN